MAATTLTETMVAEVMAELDTDDTAARLLAILISPKRCAWPGPPIRIQ